MKSRNQPMTSIVQEVLRGPLRRVQRKSKKKILLKHLKKNLENVHKAFT